jgi:hypothetical protein
MGDTCALADAYGRLRQQTALLLDGDGHDLALRPRRPSPLGRAVDEPIKASVNAIRPEPSGSLMMGRR